MEKHTNEEKYNNYKRRKILRILIMILLVTTIVLAVLSLVIKISIIYPIITLFISHILTKYRNSLSFKDK